MPQKTRKNDLVIGFTEAADPGRNFAWVEKATACDGVVIVTKSLTDRLVSQIESMDMAHVMLHLTTTGLGGTVLEPGAPKPDFQVSQALRLLDDGFEPSHLVYRVDPIVPPFLNNTIAAFDAFQPLYDRGCRRIRFSVMDLYSHVARRFLKVGFTQVLDAYDGFREKVEWHNAIRDVLTSAHERYPGTSFEECAEAFTDAFVEAKGCISRTDVKAMGLSLARVPEKRDRQGRDFCRCLACKRELFERNELDHHPCANACLYCYWKTAAERA